MISDKPDTKASKSPGYPGRVRRILRVFLAPWKFLGRVFFLWPWSGLVWMSRWVWRLLPRLSGRLSGVFPELPRELHRPAVFSLLFWSAVAITCLAWPFVRFGGDLVFGFFPSVFSILVLVGAWMALPWNPHSGVSRKMAAPAFLAGAFMVGIALPGASLLFYPIAFANAVFLFPFRRCIAYSGGVFALILANLPYIVWTYESSQTLLSVVINSVVVTVLFIPVAVFMIGISIPIVEATRRREDTESLLGELEDSHRRLESAHTELKAYSQRVGELAVSEERARMAREMHDSVGHYLTVVNVQLEAATKFMNRDPAKAGEQVAKAKSLASEALSEVRRSVRALKPPTVEGESASVALSVLANDFDDSGLDVSFVVEGEERELSAELELTLYRVLQESLTNTLKHAEARRILATLTFTEDSVRLTVRDDGSGAPGDAFERGFGLPALRERAEKSGGTLTAENAPEGGFVVIVELPAERV